MPEKKWLVQAMGADDVRVEDWTEGYHVALVGLLPDGGGSWSGERERPLEALHASQMSLGSTQVQNTHTIDSLHCSMTFGQLT